MNDQDITVIFSFGGKRTRLSFRVMSVRRVGDRREVERRTGRKTAFLERRDMVVRVKLPGLLGEDVVAYGACFGVSSLSRFLRGPLGTSRVTSKQQCLRSVSSLPLRDVPRVLLSWAVVAMLK